MITAIALTKYINDSNIDGNNNNANLTSKYDNYFGSIQNTWDHKSVGLYELVKALRLQVLSTS